MKEHRPGECVARLAFVEAGMRATHSPGKV
jgi:hypothetical protein